MIGFPIAELLDDSVCLLWLARHLHPDGFTCPHGGGAHGRVFRHQRPFPAYRCRDCHGYDTLLTGTALEKTRQRPATLVLLWRGVAKGESTARLARAWGMSRKPLSTRRQRVQTNLHDTAPTALMAGTTVEADELYQHAGENQPAPSGPHRPAPPTRQYAPRARHLCP
jgi:hypothetical protein